jgi:hypothetical protein
VTAAMMNDQIHDAHLSTTWTATVTASTTNPTLGASGTNTGSYVIAGKMVVGRVHILWGGTGHDKGSGVYFVAVPVTAVSVNGPLGAGFTGTAASAFTTFVATPYDFTKVQLVYTGAATLIGSDAPSAFDEGSFIDMFVSYEAA